MEQHSLDALRPEAKPYTEFLRNSNLSLGVYRLEAGAEDKQQPHSEDEVCYVLSGHANFRTGDRDVTVNAGDILFVPAGEFHRFYAIQQTLELLVLFAPAEGARRAVARLVQ